MTIKKLSLHHIIREPKKKLEKNPVLFMLHGYGSNEEDLFSFASELPEELFIISIRAPHFLPPFGYAWYAIHFDAENAKFSDDKEAIESKKAVVSFIDESCEAYNLDEKNVTLLGFSQGTILSYAIALSHPEKIKNVIALSGYINEAILNADYLEKDHTKLNTYASHGSVDQVIPVTWARKAPDFLKKLKIDIVFEEFPVGHGVSPQNFYAFQKWLKEQLIEN